MAKKFLTPINILNLSSDPVSASEGDLYYNTTSDKLKIYANSSWTEVGKSTTLTVSITAPTSPIQGDLWFNSDNANTYVYYDSTWVQITGTDGSVPTIFYQASAPTSPDIGDVWVDSDEVYTTINPNDYMPKSGGTFTGTITSPTISITTADTATAASHYIVETASDGVIRPKTLANARTEIVTTDAVNAAAATTVGTITSGTWNAGIIGLTYGGTNANLTAINGGVVYSTGSAMAITSAGTSGQILTSNGSSAPTWQPAPSTGFEPFFLSGM